MEYPDSVKAEVVNKVIAAFQTMLGKQQPVATALIVNTAANGLRGMSKKELYDMLDYINKVSDECLTEIDDAAEQIAKSPAH